MVKEWSYKGRRCKITKHPELGHYCGYIQTGLRFEYSTTQVWRLISVHGGITFGVSEKGWVGFDCGHSGDLCLSEDGEKLNNPYKSRNEWKPEDVKEEVEKLADQFTALEDIVHSCNRFEYKNNKSENNE